MNPSDQVEVRISNTVADDARLDIGYEGSFAVKRTAVEFQNAAGPVRQPELVDGNSSTVESQPTAKHVEPAGSRKIRDCQVSTRDVDKVVTATWCESDIHE